MILLGACTAAQTAFDAADNVIDKELRTDLAKMVERSNAELAKLDEKISEGA